MTIRPPLLWMLLASFIFAGVSVILVSTVVQAVAAGDAASGWELAFLLVLAAVGLGFAVLGPTVYIRVDDLTITSGTWLTHRRYARSQVARIRATHSPASNLTYFIRSDGSAVFSTSGYVWGEQKLRALADYMGIPLDW